LAAAAQCYLEEYGIKNKECRFDVVEVIFADGKLLVKDVIRDAFSV
jgi:Holliday junction resolvase-like predicted endonuclease